MHVIKPAGSPYYRADYLDHTGKRVRISTGCTERRAAQAKLAELLQEEERKRAAAARVAERIEQGREPITLAQALERYVAALKAADKVSHEDSASLMRKTLGRMEARKHHPMRGKGKRPRPKQYAETAPVQQRWHLDPEMPFEKLTARHLDDLIQARQSERLSATTIGHEIKLLRASARYCSDLGFAVPSIDKWRIPKAAQKTRFLSSDEFLAVFAELETPSGSNRLVNRYRQEARDLLTVLVMSGGRWSEIASLQWSRVDLASGLITIWGNKTQKDRAVPLLPKAHEVLKKRWMARSEAKSSSPWVFPARGDDDEHRKGPCRPITDAMERAGLNSPDKVRMNGRATIHSLRHTYASWLLAGGADLVDVQQALGHTTMNMTRRYSHLKRSESIRRLSTAMGRALESMSI